jgi:hypothetical protein
VVVTIINNIKHNVMPSEDFVSMVFGFVFTGKVDSRQVALGKFVATASGAALKSKSRACRKPAVEESKDKEQVARPKKRRRPAPKVQS